ncbi:hypothetical protein Tco_0249603, partial [Tanacetum coccineum]
MAEQYDLDRKAKMQVLSQESEDRRRLIQAQKIAEDMKVLQIDTSGMDSTYAAIINAHEERRHNIFGAKLHFADVALLFEFGTTAP